jgi:hypothetical protein
MEGEARRVGWKGPALVFVGTVTALLVVYRRLPVLFDVDAYYHLAVACLYRAHGLLRSLDWARYSVMHEGFGDKELLFHLGLVPFVGGDATQGGLLALALLGGLVAAALAWAAVGAIGRIGLVVPLLVFASASQFTLRIVRLRPELLSLLLVLVAVDLAAARRHRALAAVGFVYALSYTAFQTFLGLCGLFFVYTLWVERRREWGLLLAAVVGVGLGLGLHPQFPANLRVWWVQNVDFFLGPSPVDIGREIEARTTRDTLVLNLGWWIGLLALWRSRTPAGGPPVSGRLRDVTAIAAAVFGVLTLLMSRFITYSVPLVTLALVRTMGARGESPGPAVRLPWRGRLPAALVLAVCVGIGVLTTRAGGERLAADMERIFRPDMRADWEAFGRALPAGARVFAPWAATEEFVFWAPQGLYLNVLDPIFMRARDPALHRLHMDVLEGREPDVPLVAGSRFASDFYADDGQYPVVRARLAGDPRVERLHDGITFLDRFVPDANAGFLLDWKVIPAGLPVPPSLEVVLAPETTDYPRASSAAERSLEGYVDGRRLGAASECATFARALDVGRERIALEVSPYGPAEVYLDDELRAIVPPRAAVLGRGVVLPLALAPGRHRLTVRTCPYDGQLGFYALVRSREPLP